MNRMLMLLSLLLTLPTIATADADVVTIATGHTFIKKVFDPVRCAFKDKTGIDIKIVFSDPVPALGELEKGTVDAAGASLSLNDLIELAKKDGVPIKDAAAYTSYTPTAETVMIVVNSNSTVQALSQGQLKDIFSGRTTNWKEVGGDDAPILVVWPAVSSGALAVFRSTVMDNEPLTTTVYDVESIADTADAVAASPEAIGIVTATKTPQGLKQIAPAIERPLTLLYKGKPTPNLQKLLDFLRVEGKKYLK